LKRARVAVIAYQATAVLLLAASAGAAPTLSGTITNGTNGKPSAGDEVILIKLAAGMEEAGHTKTDAQGKFTFALDDAGMHLIRAVHQGVTYHQPAPPGSSSVNVTVYDVGTKVDGIKAVADLMYVQASQGKLGITRIFAVDNTSKPARTQMNDSNFEFYVPEGAEIDEAQAQTAGGQGVNIRPTPQAQKGRYAFVFPLRPGQTQFQVTYHLSYSGKATIDPKLIYPLQHFVAVLPRSINFTPQQSGVYVDKQPPDQPDGVAEVASNPQPGQKLAFDISGDGMLQSQDQEAVNGQNASGQSAANGRDNRPGGGLGAPIEAPDPLDKYRGWIIGGFGMVLITGAIYTVNRSKGPAAAVASAGLLDGLKEELFQLEIEHKQGQISDDEYARTKAALDQTLTRAIKRKGPA
jgi:hypothetical protein